MTDINKQIEEAREYRRKLIQKIRLNKANVDYILDNGLINGSLMLDIDKAMIDYQKYSSRWRKVSEEHDIPYCTALLVRFHDGDIKVGYYLDHKYREDNFYEINDNGIEFLMDSIIEWKPID